MLLAHDNWVVIAVCITTSSERRNVLQQYVVYVPITICQLPFCLNEVFWRIILWKNHNYNTKLYL
jgi:hypothetical protein